MWSEDPKHEKQRCEIFNFKDPEGVLKFKELTSSDTLSSCVQGDIKQSSKKWLKSFNNVLHRSFKKIRIKDKRLKTDKVHEFMKLKTQIISKIEDIMAKIKEHPVDIENQSKLLVSLHEKVDCLDVQIADMSASKNAEIIRNHYANITDDSGSFNIPKMWGLKRKLNLNKNNVPTAKTDKAGNLITSKNGLLALYRNTYIDRLAPKEILPEYEDLKKFKENLFELRVEIANQTKSDDWMIEDVEKVCKSLKNSKARDESGLVYELFKQSYAGPDVYRSLTKLFNNIKQQLVQSDVNNNPTQKSWIEK